MKKIIKIFNKLGPGLLFAGTAIGVSHLVQSTKAGAEYGFGITWALLLAIILKYPFFKYAPKYSLITGESILHGYHRLNSKILPIFFLITLCTMFTIQTAVTIVTAGIANSIFGNLLSVEIWTVIIITFSFLLLLIGKYKTLDKLIKYLILALAISTILSFFLAGFNFNGPTELSQVFPSNSSGIIFLIAFMGWMPAPLDVSVWNSLWSLEKKKTLKNYNLKNSMFDFNIGYFGTAILGICFIGVGYFTIYGSTETLSDSAGIFSNQLIKLYTISLGDWSYYLIAFAALSTMLSTTITALDASPRAMGITTELILNKKLKHGYLLWLIILAIGTIIIFFAFSSKMGLLIKIATILSFLTAPFYAIINYILISSKHTPIKNRPSLKMHILSIVGILYLIGFSIFFLTKGI
ncbi:MAG: iron transporter [Flavobacteriaceae bacterium]|nr:iron transporter [Flavobacteriaceae bacterium]|tara:strand:+ start:2918 stop:4144 length:1227 start_codon:yes stop_codon:yes gene_type:complete